MPFKTITIKKSTFDKLKRAKRKDESFSELFDRTFAKPDLMTGYGLLKDSPLSTKELLDAMKKSRRDAEKNNEERMRRVSAGF